MCRANRHCAVRRPTSTSYVRLCVVAVKYQQRLLAPSLHIHTCNVFHEVDNIYQPVVQELGFRNLAGVEAPGRCTAEQSLVVLQQGRWDDICAAQLLHSSQRLTTEHFLQCSTSDISLQTRAVETDTRRRLPRHSAQRNGYFIQHVHCKAFKL